MPFVLYCDAYDRSSGRPDAKASVYDPKLGFFMECDEICSAESADRGLIAFNLDAGPHRVSPKWYTHEKKRLEYASRDDLVILMEYGRQKDITQNMLKGLKPAQRVKMIKAINQAPFYLRPASIEGYQKTTDNLFIEAPKAKPRAKAGLENRPGA